MTWVKIDDKMPEHPKVVGLGAEARWLHIEGICYSNRHLTDGFVPEGALERMDCFRESGRAPFEVAKDLVAAGLWEEISTGYMIHDYLHFQQSREAVEKERDAARKRMAKVRDSRRSPELRKSSPEVRLTEVEVELEEEKELDLGVKVGENGINPLALLKKVERSFGEVG